jgi:hypothetical protein
LKVVPFQRVAGYKKKPPVEAAGVLSQYGLAAALVVRCCNGSGFQFFRRLDQQFFGLVGVIAEAMSGLLGRGLDVFEGSEDTFLGAPEV